MIDIRSRQLLFQRTQNRELISQLSEVLARAQEKNNPSQDILEEVAIGESDNATLSIVNLSLLESLQEVMLNIYEESKKTNNLLEKLLEQHG